MTTPIASSNGSGTGASVHPSANGRSLAPGATTALRMAVLVAHRWPRILAVSLATTAVAVAVALVLPKSYLTATVLVPFAGSGSRSSVALGQLPGGLGGLLGGTIGGGSPAERILGPVLASRTLADSITQRLAHDATEERMVREVLRDGVRIIRSPDGSMIVQVRAPRAQLAADIANVYPSVVNRILTRVSTEAAVTKQEFLHTQLDTADARLTVSEQRYIEFARQRAAPAAEQQAQRSIDAAAALQQGIFEQEIVVTQLRRTATTSNPDLRAAEALLASRREQLRELTNGQQNRSSVLLPVERGPELRVAATRVERQYQQDQHVYASLAAALEDAQIDASNALPVLSVLDAAVVPGRPTLNVATTAALSFPFGAILGVLSVLLAEVWARVRRDPEIDAVVASVRRTRAQRGAAVPV